MKKHFPLLLIFIMAGLISFAQEVSPADEVLKAACQQAAREKKNVFLIFHASWCGWCRKMDSSIHDASVKNYFDKNFVITHLTVLESANKKQLENPGGEAFLNKHAGKEPGLPFWIILDANGNKLADSQMNPGGNVGCPATKEEVAHLLAVLEKTSGITDKEKLAVETRFRQNEIHR